MPYIKHINYYILPYLGCSKYKCMLLSVYKRLSVRGETQKHSGLMKSAKNNITEIKNSVD